VVSYRHGVSSTVESSEQPGRTAAQLVLVAAVAKLAAGIIAILVVVFCLALAALWVAGFPGFARSAWAVVHVAAPILYSLGALLAILAAILFGRRATRLAAVGIAVLSVLGGLLSLLGIGSDVGIGNVWSAVNRAGHETRVEYVTATTSIGEQRPGFDERIALAQANFAIRRSLSGVVGDISEATRVNDEWCSYISTAATTRNRWTESVVCLADDGDVRRASFPPNTVPAVRAGFRQSRMSNVVAREAGINALFESDDAYGYIAEVDGVPTARLVVPLSDYRGWDYSIPRMPAGAMIFGIDDTGTYQAEVLRKIIPGTHPGPVVGLSAAERVRKSINDLEGFLVSARPTRSSQSLQPTSERPEDKPVDEDGNIVEDDNDDPNQGNPTEFVLYRDGVPYAVTPLTSFGAASTITAYLEVRLDTLLEGEPLQATVYRLPEGEAATTTLSNTVRVLYGQDLSEADLIYEITPTEPGRSRMTVGRQDQTRFVGRSETTIANGEPVGEICMYSRTGNELDCSQLSDDPKPLGTLVRSGAAGTTEPSASGGTSLSGDLSDVPTAALLDELERRLSDN